MNEILPEAKKCEYCTDSASFECPCSNALIFICSIHLNMHLSLLSNHSIKSLPLSYREPNLITKAALLTKLSEMKTTANNHKKNIINYTFKTIKHIEKQAKKHLKDLKHFISLCEKISSDIKETTRIPNKNFYNPLENALLSMNITDFLSKFMPPEVNFQKTESILYTPSFFPHFLYNYSDFSFGFVNQNTIGLSPVDKVIKNKAFH